MSSAMEKQPLIVQQSEPTLQDLSSRVDEARSNAVNARRELFSAQQAYQRAWSRTPRGRVWKAVFFTILALFMAIPFSGVVILGLTDDEYEEYLPRRVPLEAHIMSKCPDARDCLHDLVLPAMVNVSQYVDFKLSFIGSATNDDDGITCMHGPSECLGNILELCASNLYPDPKIYLGFVMCLSADYSSIPSEGLVQECALEHSMDFAKLNACASADDGAKGVDMLRKSVARSAAKGVQKSCTVRLDDKEWCIRDGGKWKDCENGADPKTLVDEILELRNKRADGSE